MFVYYCNEEHYNNSLEEKSKSKAKSKSNYDDEYSKLTSYIKQLYVDNGHSVTNINWAMITAQIKNIKNSLETTYVWIRYTLWYMVEIKEVNLFDDYGGSILNLVKFYYVEAKDYWQKTKEIKELSDEFDFEDNVVVMKKSVPKKKYKEIDFD